MVVRSFISTCAMCSCVCTVQPLFLELYPTYQEKVLTQLPTTTPLAITAPLIEDESYWKRCCKQRWDVCNVSEHKHCWKTMYFERHTQEMIEKFVPGQSNLGELEDLLRLSSQFVKCLRINQLLPPLQDKPSTLEEEEGSRDG